MQPSIKNGLIVGGIGFFITLVVSSIIGVCGPFIMLAGGAIAGLLTARATTYATQGACVKNSAISGAVAGMLMLFGQIIAAMLSLVILQATNTPPPFGSLPQSDAEQIGFWIGGLISGFCIGGFGVLLGAGAGAGAGAMAWRKPEHPTYGPPPQQTY
ncbi:MAG: hypothetical protein AAGF95_04235 [Chloroflexota bacterium]